jgi:hypothetical protein
MKLLDIPLGLIINFKELKLTDGVSRLEAVSKPPHHDDEAGELDKTVK